MIAFTDWQAGPEADAICAEKVMGWERNKEPSFMAWHNRRSRDWIRDYGWSPTTDRNDCAVLLREIERKGRLGDVTRWVCELGAHDEIASLFLSGDIAIGEMWKRLGFLLLADPSLVSYCCVAACEEGGVQL